MLTDRTIGSLLSLANTCFFVYYTLWIIVSPFVDTNHFSQVVFPKREYGLVIPALLIVGVLATALITTSFLFITNKGPGLGRNAPLVMNIPVGVQQEATSRGDDGGEPASSQNVFSSGGGDADIDSDPNDRRSRSESRSRSVQNVG